MLGLPMVVKYGDGNVRLDPDPERWGYDANTFEWGGGDLPRENPR